VFELNFHRSPERVMSRRSKKNVGLIGLGIIGRRVAESLRKRGFQVYVWNRTPRPVPNFVGSATEVAELCQFIQLFVADDQALMDTVEQLSPGLTAHHVVAAHCTVSPETMQSAAEIVQRRGARFLDAPFTGSKGAAEKGELIYYVAGDDGALQQARPFLEGSSKEIVEFSEIGEATLLKVATNMVTAAIVQSSAEAMALVAKCGLSPQKLARALRSNASYSGTAALKLPKMIANDFEPHFSVKHMLKDLQIAARLAQSLNLDFTVTEATRDAQLEEIKQGRGEDDFSSVARKFFPEGMPRHDESPTEPEAPTSVAPPIEPQPAPVPVEISAPAQAPAVEPAEDTNVGSAAQTTAAPETTTAAVEAVTPEPEPKRSTAEQSAEQPTPANSSEQKQSFFGRLFHRDAGR
jgi:3-hydroxyisobutyrate dehydrogenase-like beta-hydroxyacid dehydrogenase